MECWRGQESNLERQKFLLHLQIQFRHNVFYEVESWSRVLEQSIGVEWSRILEWQKYVMCVCVCGQVLCNLVLVMDQ